MKHLIFALMLVFSIIAFTPPDCVAQEESIFIQVEESADLETLEPILFAQSINDEPVIPEAAINDETPTESPGTVDEDGEPPTGFAAFWDWVKNNTAEFVLGLLMILKAIVNLTPTETDNRWYAWIENIVNTIFPNRKKGGGIHPSA